MSNRNWTFNDVDAKLAAELQEFLPARMFDTHAHIYRKADLNAQPGHLFGDGPAVTGIAAWRDHIGRCVGTQRLAGGLFIPAQLQRPVDVHNDFIVDELKSAPASRGLIMITPEFSEAKAAEYIRNSQIAGFKCYHTFSDQKPTFEAPIDSYLPEWAWRLADQHGLVILLHMVRYHALADKDNQREIREKCEKYPNAKLILAHAARSFHAHNARIGLPALRGLENVYFDLAAVSECEPIVAILEEFGPRKIMWGTDFPVSEHRGRAVTIGDGFFWLGPDVIDWDKANLCRPVLISLESLRVIREAARLFGLSAGDLDDIFYSNAGRLLGFVPQSGTVTQDTYRHAKTRIPGGVQLLSKRPEMMAPDVWPAYASESRGCETWDLDGKHYYDFTGTGIGACLLGFRDPDVTAAVRRRINLGSMSQLNYAEEVQLADELCDIHPWAEQVRYARCGGEGCAVAVRIARATTDRSVIAFCGYHGWQDWYLAANLGEDDALRGHLFPGLDPLGVPRELRGTAVPFTYGNRDEYQAILDQYGDRLAAVIMEPCRYEDPAPGFLEFIRDGAHQHGALLIFDEITIGWRLHFGGSHLRFGINPDIAVFAKALGNGHPVGAIIGTRAAMDGAHSSFISSTYWTEGVGPAAALATLRKMRQVDVPAHAAHIGQLVKGHWRTLGQQHGLPVVTDDGYPCMAHFRFDGPQANDLKTLYTQLMLKRGFMSGTYIYPSLAHTEKIVARFGDAVDATFGDIAAALRENRVKEALSGPPAHSGFRRLL
jgi:glutamate-1-semialdehyde 2,1-aminomutase